MNSSWTCQTASIFTTRNSKTLGNRFIDRCWNRNILELEVLEIKGCSEPFDFRKLLSREEKVSTIIWKVENLLTSGFLSKFKSSGKLGKSLFEDKPCPQK